MENYGSGPGSRGVPAFHVLQFWADSPGLESDPGDGSRGCGSCLEFGRNCGFG